jgi:hypothetical protein
MMVTLQEQRLMKALRDYQPFWMGAPSAWVWRGPNGPQGLGMLPRPRDLRQAHVDESPYRCFGLINLLWLSMDMPRPPTHYDARQNSLYCMLLISAGAMLVDGMPLIEQASALTLHQFHDLAATGKFSSKQEHNILPLLKLLAFRRLKEEA